MLLVFETEVILPERNYSEALQSKKLEGKKGKYFQMLLLCRALVSDDDDLKFRDVLNLHFQQSTRGKAN